MNIPQTTQQYKKRIINNCNNNHDKKEYTIIYRNCSYFICKWCSNEYRNLK